jgi:DNA-nicking Smr family endonuclease
VRSLDPEEAALWARVAATIKPLSRDKNDAQPSELQIQSPGRLATPRPAAEARQRTPARPSAITGTTLDGSWDRRLSRGSVRPDRTLDLHGHSLDTAWQAIDRGLEQAIANGERLVLLITGHRRQGDPPLPRGRIRAAVDGWLAASSHASSIAAIRPAHRSHGGGGSLYIVLRRR